MPKVTVEYFAELREQAGLAQEHIELSHNSAITLYTELKEKYSFHSDWQKLRVAINHELCDWEESLQDGDVLVFIPKVAGG